MRQQLGGFEPLIDESEAVVGSWGAIEIKGCDGVVNLASPERGRTEKPLTHSIPSC